MKMGKTIRFATLLATLLVVAFSGSIANAQVGGVRREGVISEPGVEMEVILGGDLGNNGTVYTSPVSGFATGALYADGLTANDLSYALAGTGLAGEDSATEATADEVGVTINLRSAAANLTPDVSVTIATGKTTGVTAAFSTTDVAAGATFAARAITTEDLSTQDFWCKARILVMP
jgi:hypothetical protein